MKIVGGKWSNWSGGVVCKPRSSWRPRTKSISPRRCAQATAPVRAPGTGSLLHAAERDRRHAHRPRRLHRPEGLRSRAQRRDASAPPRRSGRSARCSIRSASRSRTWATSTGRRWAASSAPARTAPGATLGSFSAEVAGFRLLLASGEILHCSPDENAEIFARRRTSLGALGVMTEIAMNVRAAYKLVEKNFLLPHRRTVRASSTGSSPTTAISNSSGFPMPTSRSASRSTRPTMPAPEPRSAEALRDRGEKGGADARIFPWINEVLPYAPFLLRPAHRLFSRLDVRRTEGALEP